MESDREEDSSAVHNVESQNDTKDIEADLKSEAIGSTLYHKTFVFDTLTKMSQSKSKEKFRDIVRCGHKCFFILLIFVTFMLRCNAAPASVRMKHSKLGQFVHFYVTSRLVLFFFLRVLLSLLTPNLIPKLVKTLVWYGTVTG